MKDDLVWIRHILDEIVFLRKIAKDRIFDDLVHDDYFAHAVRSAIEVIGEAALQKPLAPSHISLLKPPAYGRYKIRL